MKELVKSWFGPKYAKKIWFLSKQLEKYRPLSFRKRQTFGTPATTNLRKVLKTKRLDRKRTQLSDKDQKLLKKPNRQGPAAYGSIQNLMKASKLWKKNKVKRFWLDQKLTQSTALREKKIHDRKFKATGQTKFDQLLLLTWTKWRNTKMM